MSDRKPKCLNVGGTMACSGYVDLMTENERLRKLVMFAYCEGYTEAGGWWEDGKWKNSESKQALKENTNE